MSSLTHRGVRVETLSFTWACKVRKKYLMSPPPPHERLLRINELARRVIVKRRNNTVQDVLHTRVSYCVVRAVVILVHRLRVKGVRDNCLLKYETENSSVSRLEKSAFACSIRSASSTWQCCLHSVLILQKFLLDAYLIEATLDFRRRNRIYSEHVHATLVVSVVFVRGGIRRQKFRYDSDKQTGCVPLEPNQQTMMQLATPRDSERCTVRCKRQHTCIFSSSFRIERHSQTVRCCAVASRE